MAASTAPAFGFSLSSNASTSSISSSSSSASGATPPPQNSTAFSFGSAAPPSIFSSWGSDARVSVQPAMAKQRPPPSASTKSEGVVTFPSRGDSEFRYRLSRAKSDRIKIWLEDKSSKQQWESKELALSEIVTEDNAIPTMQLKDYFESFKSSFLAADTGLFRGANKHDLVRVREVAGKRTSTDDKDEALKASSNGVKDADESANDKSEKAVDDDDDDDDRVELQLTLAVQVFSKVITPTYRFALRRVKLTELDIMNARIRDQNEEIEELRAEVEELSTKLAAVPPSLFSVPLSSSGFASYPLFGSPQATAFNTPAYLYAKTAASTRQDYPMVWSCDVGSIDGGWFQLMTQGGIRFLRAGVYNVHVTVHHVNTFNPDNVGLFGNPPPGREAFHLLKNGEKIAMSFGSTVKGTTMSSPLSHILAMIPSDELSVVYCGTGVAISGCSIVIALIR